MKFSARFALVAVLLWLPFATRGQVTEPPVPEAKPSGSVLKAEPAATPAVKFKAGRPASSREIVEALSEADLDAFVPLLKDNYINPDALSELPLKRATVLGILDRIAPGAAILKGVATQAAGASPFHSEILDGRTGYVRLGSLTESNIAELDAALENFNGRSLGSLVLDLRATPASSDFRQAAAVCGRFSPKGKVLFTVRKPNIKQEQILTSKEDPRFRGILAVLVDADTAGNAEVIAAVLRTHARAMIIGEQTKGEAVEYSEFPLPSGTLVRLAVAEVALPENVSVFPGGVKPDLAVEVPPGATEAALKQGLEKGVADLVFDPERRRMNEAALVAGQNPELDELQAAQRARGEKPTLPVRDVALQRAVDFITTISIFEKKPAAK